MLRLGWELQDAAAAEALRLGVADHEGAQEGERQGGGAPGAALYRRKLNLKAKLESVSSYCSFKS